MRDPSFDVTEVRMLSRNKQIEATECQHQLNTLLTLSPILKIRQTFFYTEGFIYFAIGKSLDQSGWKSPESSD